MKLCLTCQRCYEDTYTSCVHEDHPPLVPSRPGSRLIAGKYRLDRLLGRNFMGTVYTGTQLEQKRPVLVKLLQPDSLTDGQGLQHFRREAQVIALLNARLRHPNVADTYDYGTLPEGGAYTVTELIEGYTLGHYMASSGPQLPLSAAVTVARQVADGVEAAHRVGIVHRDLKPSNIILVHDENDDRLQVKVVDFGISKLMQMIPDHTEALQSTEALTDTTRYISPEQCAGQDLDARSDIYSLGCVLYEMLSGRPPFDGDTAAEIARQHIEGSPLLITELRADVPEALTQLVMQALNKKPIIRPQTAAEFARRLRYIDYLSTALASPVTSSATPPGGLAGAARDKTLRSNAGRNLSESHSPTARDVPAESNVRMMPERNGEPKQAAASAVATERSVPPDSNVKMSRGVTIISSPAVPTVQPLPSSPDASVEQIESSEIFAHPFAQTGGIDVEEALALNEATAPASAAEAGESSSITEHEGVLIIADKQRVADQIVADNAPVHTSQLAVAEVDINEADDDTTTEMTRQDSPRSVYTQPLAEEAASSPASYEENYPAAQSDVRHATRSFTLGPLYASALVFVLTLLAAGLWMGLQRRTPSNDVAGVNPTTGTNAVETNQETSQEASQAQSHAATPGEQPPTNNHITTNSTELSATGTTGEPDAATTAVAPAATDAAASADRRSPPAADRAALRGELNKWIAATNSRNIDKQMAFYQPKVDAFYNSRNFSRDAVRAHKERVFAQASSIDMRAGDPQIILGDDGRTAIMRFRKRYVIKGRQSSRGELVQELSWVKTDAGWKIASERNVSERVLNERSANERGSSKGRAKDAKSTGSRRRDNKPGARNRRS